MLAADADIVTQQPEQQPDQQPVPESDDIDGRTQDLSAYPAPPLGDWAGWQSAAQVPPPPGSGRWESADPGRYAPTAWEPRSPRQHRSRLPWLIAGSAAVILGAAAIGGFVGDAIGSGKDVASGSASTSRTSGSASQPSTGSGAANGSGSTGSGSGSTGSGPAGGYPGTSGGYGGYGGYQGSGGGYSGSGGYDPSSGSSGSQDTGGSGPSDAASVAKHVDPGLVDINTTVDYGAAQAAGTGMVLTSNGEVLTNNHVIDGATSISVTDVGNGKTYTATVVGYSVSRDVAVLRLTGASGLRTVTTASTKASSGEEVVGIGNAGGTGGTPSYAGGTVTATGQSITASDDLTGTSEHLTGMIATNADIEAGDSGGPLVNSAGRVVGMDTAGSGSSQASAQFSSEAGGAGFAIPISTALTVAGQITAGTGSSTVHVGTTAFLGVEIAQSQSGEPGSGYGYGTSGVEISGVVSGSPAAGSGLSAGDTITAVDGHDVTSQAALQDVMTNDVAPGDRVTVEYTSSTGQRHSVSLVLTSGPPA
jgi:S1-C subfamily serine protease